MGVGRTLYSHTPARAYVPLVMTWATAEGQAATIYGDYWVLNYEPLGCKFYAPNQFTHEFELMKRVRQYISTPPHV